MPTLIITSTGPISRAMVCEVCCGCIGRCGSACSGSRRWNGCVDGAGVGGAALGGCGGLGGCIDRGGCIDCIGCPVPSPA
jgi:hypothetical protein